MPVPVVEETSTGVNGVSVTSVSVDYDTLTTINADDILIIIACARLFSDTAQYDDSTLKPSGYTLINHAGSSTSACHTAAWYKVATGSETGTLAVPNNDSADVRAAIVRISGADTSTIIDTLGADYEAGNNTAHSITGHTTGTANSLAIYLGGFDVGLPSSVAGSWTESGDFGAAGQRPGLTVGYLDMATAGATGTADITIPASQGMSGFTFSILEASTGFTLTADSGSFTMTGTDAALARARGALSADAGSFSLSGAAAGLYSGRLMPADSGTFTLTGTDAAIGQNTTLAADAGSFAYSGTDVGLLGGLSLAAETTLYALTGTDANLSTLNDLQAESGAFTLSGTAAGLHWGHYFLAEMGAVQMSANDVTFSTGIRLSADSGSFTLSGADIAFQRSYAPLTADSATFTYSGTDNALYWNRYMAGASGAYALTGTDATLSASGAFAIPAEPGTFSFSGTDVAFVFGPLLSAESASFSLAGTGVTLSYSAADTVLVSLKGDIVKRLTRAPSSTGRIRVH